MIPGLNFLLGRGAPFCIGVTGLVLVSLMIAYGASRASRGVADSLGEEVRAWFKWTFTWRNFIVLGFIALIVGACLGLLFLTRYL